MGRRILAFGRGDASRRLLIASALAIGVVVFVGKGFGSAVSLAETGALTGARVFHIAETLQHAQPVTSVAWSPDGKYLATSNFLSARVDLWDIDSGRITREFRADFAYGGSIAFSKDGQHLLTAAGVITPSSPGAAVTIWDVRTGEITGQIPGLLYPDKGPAYNAARIFTLASDGSLLAVVAEQNVGAPISLYDARDWKRLGGVYLGDTPVVLALSPHGETVAVGTIGGQIALFDTSSRVLVQKIDAYKGYPVGIASLAFSPDGRFVASGPQRAMVSIRTSDGKLTSPPPPSDPIRIWNTIDGTLVRSFAGSLIEVRSLAWSGDGAYLASASDDHTVRLWRTGPADAGTVIATFRQPPFAVEFSRDSKRLAAGGDNVAVIVDVQR